MKVLVSDRIAEDGINLLRESVDVDVKVGISPDELKEIIGEYDGLVVRSETKVTAEVIARANRLKVVGRAGVGVDNIDIEAASRRGIIVVNAPAANTIAAAEHTIALMLSMARNIPQAAASMCKGEWQRSRYMGVEIRNKTLGIIGLGRIGIEVAKRAQGLMMQVIGYDPFVSPEFAAKAGIQVVSLDELLSAADFITLHTPMTKSTRGMIGARELSLMKPTARLINCARGGLIDEEALHEALEQGKVAGAALDVFSQEPPKDCPLVNSGKVVTTPHLGASTHEAQIVVAIDVANQVLSVLRGEPATYAINAPVISPETMAALGSYLPVGEQVGAIFGQLQGGQLSALEIVYNGELASFDTAPLTAAVLKGLLEPVSEEQVTLMNAMLIAKSRGLAVREQKTSETTDNYASMITVRAAGSDKPIEVAGTLINKGPHIVRLNHYRIDVVPSSAHYVLFAEHTDKPGVIGQVGTIIGKSDVNISFMQVGRVVPRGKAMMVLGLDEPISGEVLDQVKAVGDIGDLQVVRLSS